jgi:hypothetical protein
MSSSAGRRRAHSPSAPQSRGRALARFAHDIIGPLLSTFLLIHPLGKSSRTPHSHCLSQHRHPPPTCPSLYCLHVASTWQRSFSLPTPLCTLIDPRCPPLRLLLPTASRLRATNGNLYECLSRLLPMPLQPQ